MNSKVIWLSLLPFTLHAGTMGDILNSQDWLKKLEISAEGGPNWLNPKDTTLLISPSETDSNKVRSVSNNASWKVGIGYALFEGKLANRTYLNHFLFEINVYQISGKMQGNVWQYELPQFNNYIFSAPITSTRLMFDIKPTLIAWRNVSFYPLLGIGPSWNALSYSETITGTDVAPNSQLILGKNTITQFAADIGAGAEMMLTDNLSATAEYIYGFLGHASPSVSSSNGVQLASSPTFSLQTQNLFFGLRLKL